MFTYIKGLKYVVVARSAGGNNYKTTEDYHDEVTELKKVHKVT